jgi:arginine exporter protein ArgO
MDPYDAEQRERRQTFLGVFLGLIGVTFFTLVLIFLSNGVFFYVLVLCGGIAFLCLFNYLLWGKNFSEETASEREEEEMRQQTKQDEWEVMDARRSWRE